MYSFHFRAVLPLDGNSRNYLWHIVFSALNRNQFLFIAGWWWFWEIGSYSIVS